jgi:hypothetical protein
MIKSFKKNIKNEENNENILIYILNTKDIKYCSILRIWKTCIHQDKEKQKEEYKDKEFIENYQIIPNAYPPNVPQIKKAIESNENISLIYKQTIFRSQYFSPYSSCKIKLPIEINMSNDIMICLQVWKGLRRCENEIFKDEESTLWYVILQDQKIQYVQTKQNMSTIKFMCIYICENINVPNNVEYQCKYKIYQEKKDLTIGIVEINNQIMYFGKNCCVEPTEIDQFLINTPFI